MNKEYFDNFKNLNNKLKIKEKFIEQRKLFNE